MNLNRREFMHLMGLAGAAGLFPSSLRASAEPGAELYDMAADRTELNDLAAEKPELVDELIAKYEAWAERVGV